MSRFTLGQRALILATIFLCVGRLQVPTVGHSWPAVFTAAAHIFVGWMLAELWRARGKWPLGWACLMVPTTLEAAMFFMANPP